MKRNEIQANNKTYSMSTTTQFADEVFSLATVQKTMLKRGDICRAASNLIQGKERRGHSSAKEERSAATAAARSASAEAPADCLVLHARLRSLLQKWSSAAVPPALSETRSVFDSAAAHILSHPDNLEANRRILLLCEEVWKEMARAGTAEASRFLTTCLEFVASAEEALDVSDLAEEGARGDGEEEEEREHDAAGENWFASAVSLYRIFSSRQRQEHGKENLLPTAALRELADDCFWTNLGDLLSCIESSQRLFRRVTAPAVGGGAATDGGDDHIESIAHNVADSLLLRIDFHFGGGTTDADADEAEDASQEEDDDNDDEPSISSADTAGNKEKKKKKKKKKKKTKKENNNAEEDHSHRPEHLLRYIGSQWILLRCFSASTTTNGAPLPRSFTGQLEKHFCSGASRLFNRICIAPIIATLESSAASPLLDLITSAAVKATSSAAQHLSVAQKEKVVEKQHMLDNLLDGNVRLLHVVNVLSEAVRQLEGSSANGAKPSAFPCIGLLTDPETAVVSAALISAMRDYCAGVLETASAPPTDAVSRVVKIANESAWEQIIHVAEHGGKGGCEKQLPDSFLLSASASSTSARSNAEAAESSLIATLGQLRRPEFVSICATMITSLCNSIKPILAAVMNNNNDEIPLFTSLFLHVLIWETVLSRCATRIAQELALLGAQFIAATADPSCRELAPCSDPRALRIAGLVAAIVVKVCVPLLELEDLCQGQLPRFLEQRCNLPAGAVSQLVVDPCARATNALRARLEATMVMMMAKGGEEEEGQQQLRVAQSLLSSVLQACLQKQVLLGKSGGENAATKRILELLTGKAASDEEEEDSQKHGVVAAAAAAAVTATGAAIAAAAPVAAGVAAASAAAVLTPAPLADTTTPAGPAEAAALSVKRPSAPTAPAQVASPARGWDDDDDDDLDFI